MREAAGGQLAVARCHCCCGLSDAPAPAAQPKVADLATDYLENLDSQTEKSQEEIKSLEHKDTDDLPKGDEDGDEEKSEWLQDLLQYQAERRGLNLSNASQNTSKNTTDGYDDEKDTSEKQKDQFCLDVCGGVARGEFCTECGLELARCHDACGGAARGKFCTECGLLLAPDVWRWSTAGKRGRRHHQWHQQREWKEWDWS